MLIRTFDHDKKAMSKIIDQLDRVKIALNIDDIRSFRRDVLGQNYSEITNSPDTSTKNSRNTGQRNEARQKTMESIQTSIVSSNVSSLRDRNNLVDKEEILPTLNHMNSATLPSKAEPSNKTLVSSHSMLNLSSKGNFDEEIESPFKQNSPFSLSELANRKSLSLSKLDHLYEKTDHHYLVNFKCEQSIFLESAPHHSDIVTNYDVKYLNIVVYSIVRNYVAFRDLSGGTGYSEANGQHFLALIKNKLKIMLREQKLTDMLFKIEFGRKENQLFSHIKSQTKALLPSILEDFKSKIMIKANILPENLKSSDDYKLIGKVFRHFIMLLGIIKIWYLNYAGLDESVYKCVQDGIISEYDKIATYFLESPVESLTGIAFQKEILKILDNQLFSDQTKFSYPVNN